MPRTIINRLKSAIPSFLFLFLIHSVFAQSGPSGTQTYAWDLSIQITGASGEENSNAFSEAQILTAGVFVGKALTGEIGNSWKRGSLEYGFELVPLLLQIRPQRIYGGAFEPLILRWNSGLHIGHTTAYLELAGAGVRTISNLPAGDTLNFNFAARGGGGIQIFTNDRQSVDIGCRWWHISNANLGTRNPEFNGVQLSLGYHWFR